MSSNRTPEENEFYEVYGNILEEEMEYLLETLVSKIKDHCPREKYLEVLRETAKEYTEIRNG